MAWCTAASPQTPLPRTPYGLGKASYVGVGVLERGFQTGAGSAPLQDGGTTSPLNPPFKLIITHIFL
jgi:hypothetical protein